MSAVVVMKQHRARTVKADLIAARKVIEENAGVICELVHETLEQEHWRTLGYKSAQTFFVDTLGKGMNSGLMYTYARAGRLIANTPKRERTKVREAVGRIGVFRAVEVERIARKDPAKVAQWLERAEKTSVRTLREQIEGRGAQRKYAGKSRHCPTCACFKGRGRK